MNLFEITCIIIWLMGGFFIAFSLKKKFIFFRGPLGSFVFLMSFVILVFIHNIVSGLLKIDEPLFFLLAFFSLGAFVFSIIIQALENIIRKEKVKGKEKE